MGALHNVIEDMNTGMLPHRMLYTPVQCVHISLDINPDIYDASMTCKYLNLMRDLMRSHANPRSVQHRGINRRPVTSLRTTYPRLKIAGYDQKATPPPQATGRNQLLFMPGPRKVSSSSLTSRRQWLTNLIPPCFRFSRSMDDKSNRHCEKCTTQNPRSVFLQSPSFSRVGSLVGFLR